MTAGEVALQAERIDKRYPGTLALDGVDFTVRRGKVNVLIGENGAGKSTLMKILAGVEQPTAGRLLLDGREISFSTARQAERAGIAIIHQELNLLPNLTVAENIFLARERTRCRGLLVDHRSEEQRAARLLATLGQSLDPRAIVGSLRLGEQQMVEIARALAAEARVLIMDEPTASLGQPEVEALFDVMRSLKEQGTALVYISHRLEELLRIGDHITVLRDGRLVGESPVGEVDSRWIVERMIGRPTHQPQEQTRSAPGGGILEIENVTLPRPGGGLLLDGVSLSLRAGEIVGLYGLRGAGRTELLECVAGLRNATAGRIRLGKRPIERLPIPDRIRSGLMLVPEDRRRAGLVQSMSVAENITLASLGRFAKLWWLNPDKERMAVDQAGRDLTLRAPHPDAPVTALSGGNQQKVTVARAMLTRPRVLLLDDPTRGIDVGARADLYATMRRLASSGLGVIFASSDVAEILALADRIAVMARGRISGLFARGAATEEALVGAAGADASSGGPQ